MTAESTAIAKCVPASALYVAFLGTPVVEVMKTMARRGYSQAPVLRDGVVIGVFGESTPFAMVLASSELHITAHMTIEDCGPLLGLDRAFSEVFAFVGKHAPWTEVEKLFAAQRDDGKRVGAVFVTEAGAPTEKLLGMITAWDLAPRP